MLRAAGKGENCCFEELFGSKDHFIVFEPDTIRPSRVVAAKVAFWDFRRGIRKVEVQPAPRIRMSRDCPDAIFGVITCWRAGV